MNKKKRIGNREKIKKERGCNHPKQVGDFSAGMKIKAIIKTKQGKKIKVRGKIEKNKGGQLYLIADNIKNSKESCFGPGTRVMPGWDVMMV
ncbi:hypothetical protein AMJ49_03755 [Parcubacteria bacterium DG_74_2]|nr:MAG: hypothetical protein AMJ49_03755 [Parcubacteria bacterium DG_74_2]